MMVWCISMTSLKNCRAIRRKEGKYILAAVSIQIKCNLCHLESCLPNGPCTVLRFISYFCLSTCHIVRYPVVQVNVAPIGWPELWRLWRNNPSCYRTFIQLAFERPQANVYTVYRWTTTGNVKSGNMTNALPTKRSKRHSIFIYVGLLRSPGTPQHADWH